MALAKIFCKMLEDLAEKKIERLEDINIGLGGGNKEVIKKKYYHLIILVRNQVGLKNLYKIVSEAHTNYFFKKPGVASILNKYRDGLLIGSACEAGDLPGLSWRARASKSCARSRNITIFWMFTSGE